MKSGTLQKRDSKVFKTLRIILPIIVVPAIAVALFAGYQVTHREFQKTTLKERRRKL